MPPDWPIWVRRQPARRTQQTSPTGRGVGAPLGFIHLSEALRLPLYILLSSWLSGPLPGHQHITVALTDLRETLLVTEEARIYNEATRAIERGG